MGRTLQRSRRSRRYAACALLALAALAHAATDTTSEQQEQAAATLFAAGLSGEALGPARLAVAMRRTQQPADPLALAQALATLGEIERDQGLLDDARRSATDSCDIRRRLLPPGDVRLARCFRLLGAIEASSERPQSALAYYRQALTAFQEADPLGVDTALALRDVAAMLIREARDDEARALLSAALRMLRSGDGMGRSAALALVLQNLGDASLRTGSGIDAGPLLGEAIALRRAARPAQPLELAQALESDAGFEARRGHLADANGLAREALALTQAARGERHADVATAEMVLADVLHRSGDLDGAIDVATRALALRRQLLPAGHTDLARGDAALGLLLHEAGRHEEGLARLDAAAAVWDRHPQLSLERAITAHNRGGVLQALGRPADARLAFEQALALWKTLGGDDNPYTAVTLNQLAEVQDSLGQTDIAQGSFDRALELLLRHGQMPMETAMAWSRIADHYQRQQAYALAIFAGKQAVNGFQALRADLATLDNTLQQGLLAQRSDVYQNLAGRLVDAGRLAEAQQVMRMLKEDELSDFQRGDANSPPAGTTASLSPSESEIAAQFALLAAEQSQSARQLRELEAAGATRSTGEDNRIRRRELLQALARGREAFIAFSDKLRREAPRTADEPQGAIEAAQLEALQSQLASAGHGAVLLNYVVSKTELRIIVTTPRRLFAHSAPIGSAQLNRAIAQFREQIRTHDPAVQATARQLYDWLIAPIDDQLREGGARTLMLATVGTLRYLPFAALYDGRQWLVQRYAVSLYTPAGASREFLPPMPQWRVSAFGVAKRIEGFDPLPSVSAELAGIVGDGALPGTILLDDKFTLDALEDAAADQPGVMHIASHFVFRPGTENDSFLLLGNGQHLSLTEMRGITLRSLDLLTLSACDTAIGGGQNENGREIEGFAALAQQRGAAAVLATLWPVADASTAQLMQRFYWYRQHEGLTKGEALQRAQLEFVVPNGTAATAAAGAPRGARRVLATGESAAVPTDLPGTEHPFYWAPFVLMGNWL